MSRYNVYWNPEYGKTYSDLTMYFLPENWKNPDPEGFFSERYQMKYFDGYGYNFFYTQNEYYEYTKLENIGVNEKMKKMDYRNLYQTKVIYQTLVFCVLFFIIYAPYKIS